MKTSDAQAAVVNILDQRVNMGAPSSSELAQGPDLLPALVALLHTDEALQLFRLLWTRVRDRFPVVLRWLGDRLIGKPASA